MKKCLLIFIALSILVTGCTSKYVVPTEQVLQEPEKYKIVAVTTTDGEIVEFDPPAGVIKDSIIVGHTKDSLQRFIPFSEVKSIYSSKMSKVFYGFLTGSLTGIGAAMIGAGIVTLGGGGEEEANTGANIGLFTGYVIGSAFGVYIVGDTDEETGLFWATFVGSLAGGCLFVVPAPIGATIGFNATRKYKTPPAPETGLLNFRNGEIALGVPTIHLQPDPFVEKMLYQNVDLVTIRF